MNKKNWLLLFFACAIAFTSFNSCKKDDDDINTGGGDTGPTEWTKSVVYTGDPRSGAASFNIEGKGAYVIGGYVNPAVGIAVDGRVFNGTGWSTVADFTGPARYEAVGFTINGKGYIGTGRNLDNEVFNDFYSYNPSTDSWEEVAPLPNGAAGRSGAIAFTLGDYAYVGLGTNQGGGRLGDLYRFDPSAGENGKWEAVDNLPFKDKLSGAFAFVIGNKAYIGGGYSNSAELPDGFYSFDGSKWETLPSLKRSDEDYTYDARKYNAASFVIGNYGYVVSGRNANSVTSSVWKYDPTSRSWTDKHQALSTDAREKAVGFAIDGKGYVVTGVNGSLVYDNMYEFTPVR